MERGIGVTLQTPHSLGKLIEWKHYLLTVMAVGEPPTLN